MRRVLCVFLFLATIGGAPGWSAAAADWSRLSTPVFSNLGVEQGLPYPVTLAVAQDTTGFVWIGTLVGLARYDGYRFTIFRHKDGDPTSLANPAIVALAGGTDGRMWVADYFNNILRYDPAADNFQTVPESLGLPAIGSIDSLIADGEGGVWIGSKAGLFHVDGQTLTVNRFLRLDESSGPPDHIEALLLGKDGRLWVSTDRGLWSLPPRGKRFDTLSLPAWSDKKSDMIVLALTEDDNGLLWFVTAAQQFGSIDPARGDLVRPIARQPTSTHPPFGHVGMVLGRPGELWLGTYGGGLLTIDTVSGAMRRFVHNENAATSLADNIIWAMLRDRSGLIWLGTGSGISQVDPLNEVFESILPSGGGDGLSGSAIVSLAAAHDGPIWLGTKSSGIARLDLAEGRITGIAEASGQRLANVPGLTIDAGGDLWVGVTGNPGLYVLRRGSAALADSHWVGQMDTVYRRLLVQGGSVWMAAGPLVRFDPVTGQSRVYRHTDDPASLHRDGVIVLAPADDGRIWVGTGDGLDLFDPAKEIFRHYLHDPGRALSMPSGAVSALMTDRRGRLWVGMLGNGLAIGTPDGQGEFAFRHLSSADGLPSDIVAGLLEDRQGRIWASTINALAVIDPDTLAVQSLNSHDGVTVASYSVGAAVKLDDGDLLFGGGGITVVHPDRPFRPRVSVPVAVTAFQVDGQSRSSTSLNVRRSLTLSPQERKFEVEFAALDFIAPEKLSYAYRLDGFDRDWSSTDAMHRTASYSNLPPGAYRLLVKSTDSNGNTSATLSLALRVWPAWWQGWWFRLVVAAAAAALVALLVRARTALLHRRSVVLKALVARQTRDLTESNARLAELAARDPLTGLLNRRAFFEHGESEIDRAHRYQNSICLMMIDIDHFKSVNDTYGHASGDEVLRSLARLIQIIVRNSDICVRLGGEELAVLMPETSDGPAALVAERLRRAVEQEPFRAAESRFQVTVSIGFAAVRAGESLSQLLERADQALYAAKRAGRNQVMVAPAG